jgi:hypothetical protein
LITTHIIGGLGNQMFQYAAGRALSLAKQVPFSLDISDFSGYRLHQGFELQRVFNCPIRIASEAEVRALLGWQSWSLARRVLARPALSILRRQEYVFEPHFNHWAGISDAPADSYLVGYWQSEKYFREAAQTIRADFTFKSPLSLRNAELVEQIRGGNAVSLHVRRGDYVKNPKTMAVHGVCSLDYYRSAIQHVAARVEQPVFFVFSDDLEWVRKNLKIDFHCQYVDHNQGSESYNDMRLMSLCRHHIIANSSFSWWGAWLNASPNKIVTAPKKWFSTNGETVDLFPDGWVLL